MTRETKQEETWTRDDEDWFDLLSGKTVDNASPENRLLAENLRKTILVQQREKEMEPSEKQLNQERQRLLFRLQKEGLLKKKKRHLTPYLGLAMAACLAFFLVTTPTVQQYLNPTKKIPTITTKKQFTAPQVIYSTDPGADADRFANEMEKLGLHIERMEEEGSWIVVVEVTGKPAALEKTLRNFDIEPIDSGKLIVEFMKK